MAQRTELESVQAVALMCADELAAKCRIWLQRQEQSGNTESGMYRCMSRKVEAYAEASIRAKMQEHAA